MQMQKWREGREREGREACRQPSADSQIHRSTVQKIEGLKSLPFCSGRIQYSKMTDPLTTAMCRDMIWHIYSLQGTAFIESELAYYKAFEARRFPAAAPAPAPPAPMPAPLAPVPAPPAPKPAHPAPTPAVVLHAVAPPPMPASTPIRLNPLCTVKKEETEVVVEAAVEASAVAEAAAGAGAGAAPAPAENKVIVAPAAEKTRYKRTELPDEERCIDVTARGTRCTLGRHEKSEYCQRHLKKHSS